MTPRRTIPRGFLGNCLIPCWCAQQALLDFMCFVMFDSKKNRMGSRVVHNPKIDLNPAVRLMGGMSHPWVSVWGVKLKFNPVLPCEELKRSLGNSFGDLSMAGLVSHTNRPQCSYIPMSFAPHWQPIDSTLLLGTKRTAL